MISHGVWRDTQLFQVVFFQVVIRFQLVIRVQVVTVALSAALFQVGLTVTLLMVPLRLVFASGLVPRWVV